MHSNKGLALNLIYSVELLEFVALLNALLVVT